MTTEITKTDSPQLPMDSTEMGSIGDMLVALKKIADAMGSVITPVVLYEPKYPWKQEQPASPTAPGYEFSHPTMMLALRVGDGIRNVGIAESATQFRIDFLADGNRRGTIPQGMIIVPRDKVWDKSEWQVAVLDDTALEKIYKAEREQTRLNNELQAVAKTGNLEEIFPAMARLSHAPKATIDMKTGEDAVSNFFYQMVEPLIAVTLENSIKKGMRTYEVPHEAKRIAPQAAKLSSLDKA